MAFRVAHGAVVRGIAVAGVALAAVLGVVPSAATAPEPSSVEQATKQFKDLSDKAERIQQAYLKAQDDLKARRHDLAVARGDLQRADGQEKTSRGQQGQFRGQVDQFSDATYQGADLAKLSALMQGSNARDYLDRASALKVISSDNTDALNRLSKATDDAAAAHAAATAATQRAQQATDQVTGLLHSLQQQKATVAHEIDVVEAAKKRLSPAVSEGLNQGSDSDASDAGQYIAGAGAGTPGAALRAALSQLGVPYVWGGTTPSGFDCSGLTSWAYRQAGVSIPRSSQSQSVVGQSVSRDELQPGDLVFFGSPVHHVGMYVGGGKMVDAPNSGEVVRVESLQSDYSGARRVG